MAFTLLTCLKEHDICNLMINRILLRLTEMFSRYKKNITTFKIDLRKKGELSSAFSVERERIAPKETPTGLERAAKNS